MIGRKDGYSIQFDARLIEETVRIVEADLHPLLSARFHRERDVLYRVEDEEDRERAFSRFHQTWFERMELGEPVARAVGRIPEVKARTNRCVVLSSSRADEEDADLREETPVHGPSPREAASAGPTIVIRLRPATLADGSKLDRFLKHELLHVADMLDPAFGYRAELPAIGQGGPARQRQVQARYRVLWDCTIDGRLHAGDATSTAVLAARRREFELHFPELNGRGDREFRRWFEGPRPTHDEILLAAGAGAPALSSGICSLCRFPYAELMHDPERIPAAVLRAIRADFPAWNPAAGVCTPCVDLYATAR